MAGKVLRSIETDGVPVSTSSVLSDDTYIEEEIPDPDDPETRLSWGRKHNGEGWYREEVAGREAARNAQREEEERERGEDEKLDAIRSLLDTDPPEYQRRMREYNLQLQGLTKAQIHNSIQPLPSEVIESNWAGFAALLLGKVQQPPTADKAYSEAIDSQPRVSPKQDSRKICRRIVKSNRSKRPAKALVDEETTSHANPLHSNRKTKLPTAKRASRRLAGQEVECGIFAPPSAARRVPKSLQRYTSTDKRSPHNISGHAKSQGSKSGLDGTRRSRPKK
ncbi:hypothetical protein DL98DRAFT_521486 [Cadophora sp. DSE1049]|nr:hypothetical protein DL98DRAFT_521486 [Cadophora sp. DSE1049]